MHKILTKNVSDTDTLIVEHDGRWHWSVKVVNRLTGKSVIRKKNFKGEMADWDWRRYTNDILMDTYRLPYTQMVDSM